MMRCAQVLVSEPDTPHTCEKSDVSERYVSRKKKGRCWWQYLENTRIWILGIQCSRFTSRLFLWNETSPMLKSIPEQEMSHHLLLMFEYSNIICIYSKYTNIQKHIYAFILSINLIQRVLLLSLPFFLSVYSFESGLSPEMTCVCLCVDSHICVSFCLYERFHTNKIWCIDGSHDKSSTCERRRKWALSLE